MARVRISAVLALTIVILLTKIGAKPQSEIDHIGQIQTEDFSHPETDSEHTADRERGIVPPSTATSIPDTTSRLRRGVTEPQNGYKSTPGLGTHKIYTSAKSWHDARKICQKDGGDLAIINTPTEAAAVGALLATSQHHVDDSDDSNYALIGFDDISEEGNYVTVDGRSLKEAGYETWAADEPNDQWWNGGEDCGSINGAGKLNDISCWGKYAFVCELPIPLDHKAGPAGPVGPQGIPGIKGEKGTPGSTGLGGTKGEPGERGTQGAAGVSGSKGETGPLGPPGVKGNRGDPGPTGPSGLAGPVGPPGSNGANGLKGVRGEPGYCSCPAGLKGEKGDPGTTGVPGLPGQHGVPGTNGLNGRNGGHGFDGQDGEEGRTGAEGDDGSQGEKGEKGDKGDKGPGKSTPHDQIRRTAPNAVPGPQGPKGETGSPGPRGEPGLGYDVACLSFLLNLQYSRGGDLIDGEQDRTFFGNKNFAEECRDFITKAYDQMNRTSSPNPDQPDGMKKSPAKTCKDLFVADPDMPSGEYWIDPNEGDVSDAILVHCNAEERSTCLVPRINRTEPIAHIGEEPEIWLSELGTEMQITYGAADQQISTLQMLSSHAKQTITYHCMKSVGYFDAESETYGRGLKLLAWNDFELRPTGNGPSRYTVLSDGCQDRLNEWKETVITYRTDRPSRLPVMDVGVRDIGKPDQQFSVEIGKVCFK